MIKNSGILKGVDFFWELFQKPKCFREEVVDDIYRREFLLKTISGLMKILSMKIVSLLLWCI